MSLPEAPWTQYDQAYKRLHEKLSEILAQISKLTQTATPWTVTAVAGGDTVIKEPSSGKKLRVKLVDVWNNGSAEVTVSLKFAAGGTARFRKTLAAKTGFVMNLVGCSWEGNVGDALIISLSSAGTVDVTVMGEEL
ncbi:MAG: hypothetical protein QW840_03265 [Candidatus Bathyarchaeia archaeon]